MKRTVRSSKSHGGCHRCKAKKIKCDETVPACQMCLQAGQECPGYTPQYKWSRKHEKFCTETAPRPKKRARLSPLAVTGTDEANRASPSNSRDAQLGMEGSRPEEMPFWTDQTPTAPMDPELSDWLNLEMGRYDDMIFSSMAIFDQSLGMNAPLPSATFTDPARPPADDGTLATNQLLQEAYEHPQGSSESGEYASLALNGETANRNSSSSPPQMNYHAGPRSLLETFYRTSIPTPVAQFSEDHLVKHYFSEVCALYSCFDSHLNPFRTLVADHWTSSATIYVAIQSMAIAHLANDYRYMAPLGLAKRSQSWKSLQADLQLYRSGKIRLERVLLSLLLLGLSSAWHQPANLGLQYLFIARTLMQGYFRCSVNDESSMSPANGKFFQDALLYWEMLHSFVDPVPMASFPGYGMGMPAPTVPSEEAPIFPHPWTGVSAEVHFAVAEIGRILRRRQRRSAMKHHVHRRGSVRTDECDEPWAASLERFLHSIQIPSPNAVIDYADEDTPKSDLVNCANAHRCIGLLELYRAFPQLLESKFSTHERFPATANGELDVPTDHSSYTNAHDSRLCALAISTLQTIQDISIASASCRLQPLILVSCASHLRLPDVAFTPMDERQDEVIETRSFVEARMLALACKYPQRQLLQMLDIIKEAWQRLDNGNESAHWLDVVHEKGWQTIMG